jgi:hypothetical protein
MENTLYKITNESTDIFFEEEVENILNDVAERNLCGRLAIYVTNKLKEYKISGYYADPEYNRKQGGQVKTIMDGDSKVIPIQCDLIIHSRGNNISHDNLVAIEMKKSTRPEEEKVADRNRLRAMTKRTFNDTWSADGITHPEHVCGYILGVYMILNISRRTCVFEYYRAGNKFKEETKEF